MKFWPKSRKQRAIEHWEEMAERYRVLADQAHGWQTNSVPFSVHYRVVSTIYRANAAEIRNG